jgi:hypothetical protein
MNSFSFILLFGPATDHSSVAAADLRADWRRTVELAAVEPPAGSAFERRRARWRPERDVLGGRPQLQSAATTVGGLGDFVRS